MQVPEFSRVVLKDGREANVADVLGGGEAYIVDIPKPMKGDPDLVTFDTETVLAGDIAEAPGSPDRISLDDYAVLTAPGWESPVDYDIRAAIAYCEGKGMTTEDLTDDELKAFERPNQFYSGKRAEGEQMEIREFDKVELKSGIVGDVVEILEPGVAYIVDYPTPDGENAFDDVTVRHADIASIVLRASDRP